MGAVVARAVVRHDDRTRRGDDNRSGSRNDNRSCHDRGGRHDDWRRLRHDNGLRDNRSGLRDDDRSGLRHNRSRLRDNGGLRIDDDWRGLRHNSRLGDDCWLRDDGRLRVDDDGGWRFNGFRDVGDGVHDVKHRVEAAVVEGATMMVMGLGLDGVARQQDGGDGQTEDGVACVFHGVLLFVGWFVR